MLGFFIVGGIFALLGLALYNALNTTDRVQDYTVPFSNESRYRNMVTTAGITYYPGAMMGLNASGLVDKFDDTQSLKFEGLCGNDLRIITDTTTEFKMSINRPAFFMALIASAAAGDEGKIVYAKYDNEVSYTPGTHGNIAGTVEAYIDSTHVLVRPPYGLGSTSGGSGALPYESNGNLTTVGAGTLTATLLVANRTITRSGSVAAFTDTTDTAAAIIAAVPDANIGEAWKVTIKNTTAFAQTLSGGSSVTLSGQTVIPPLSVGTFLVSIATATTVTMQGLFIAPMTTPPITAQGTLTTVGAGTVLAATIAGGLLLRTGSTSAFTDTTDTGTLLAAAIPNIQIGESFEFTYQNQTKAVATLTGGVGVNAAATFGVVGAGCWMTFLFTYTAANTFSVVIVNAGSNFGGLPPFSYATGTTTGTFTAAEMVGGQLTVYNSTATTPGSIATATATAMFAAAPNAHVGQQWVLRIINSSASANTMTITADASVTLSGTTTYTIAEFAYRDFLMTFTTPTTATMVAIGGGAAATN